MVVLLSLTLGIFVGLAGRSATYVAAAAGLVLSWALAALTGGADLAELATSIALYNCGLAAFFAMSLTVTSRRAAR